MQKLRTNYQNGEKFYAEDMNLVTGTINDMIDAVDSKQGTLIAGANIEITSGGTISVTGITEPIASDFDIKDLSDTTGLREEWSGKQDALTAGDNIEITSEGTISATDTTYVASDFDIKDLADSTGLREEWSSKQDALIEVIEDGFYIVDENMNIGFYVDSTGAHSINLVEYKSVN